MKIRDVLFFVSLYPSNASPRLYSYLHCVLRPLAYIHRLRLWTFASNHVSSCSFRSYTVSVFRTHVILHTSTSLHSSRNLKHAINSVPFFLTLFSCFHSISGRHIHALQALYFDPGDHSVCMYSSVCRMCLLLPSEIHAIRSGDDSDVIERRGVRGPISVTAVLSHNEQDIRLIV